MTTPQMTASDELHELSEELEELAATARAADMASHHGAIDEGDMQWAMRHMSRRLNSISEGVFDVAEKLRVAERLRVTSEAQKAPVVAHKVTRRKVRR